MTIPELGGHETGFADDFQRALDGELEFPILQVLVLGQPACELTIDRAASSMSQT